MFISKQVFKETKGLANDPIKVHVKIYVDANSPFKKPPVRPVVLQIRIQGLFLYLNRIIRHIDPDQVHIK